MQDLEKPVALSQPSALLQRDGAANLEATGESNRRG